MNARTAYETLSTEQIEVALFLIEHEALSEPIRLSTDPTDEVVVLCAAVLESLHHLRDAAFAR